MTWLKKVQSAAASLLRIRWVRRSAGLTAIMAAILATTSLMAAAPASAASDGLKASRGFDILNTTADWRGNPAAPLRLTDVFTPPRWPYNWPMAFEGRPALGSVLAPGKTQRWEIGFWGHAAIAQYKINAEWNVFFWMGSWLGTVSGCGFAKAGDPPPYLDPHDYPVDPGPLPDHGTGGSWYCKTDGSQELQFGNR